MRWQGAWAVAQCGHEACPWFVTCHMAFPISARSAGAVPAERERKIEGEREIFLKEHFMSLSLPALFLLHALLVSAGERWQPNVDITHTVVVKNNTNTWNTLWLNRPATDISLVNSIPLYSFDRLEFIKFVVNSDVLFVVILYWIALCS